jgi:hypothetical protein
MGLSDVVVEIAADNGDGVHSKELLVSVIFFYTF